MVKRILVPVVFSKYSEGIVEYAADIAAATGAELIFVSVINERDLMAVDKIASYGYNVDMEHYVDTIKKERKEALERLIAPLTLPDDRVSYCFCLGIPSYELLKLVVDREVDMVIMGVRTNDFSHIFTGSVAEKMFRKCPVTLVSYREGEVRERLQKQFLKHRAREEKKAAIIKDMDK